jgi:hypothetical protein
MMLGPNDGNHGTGVEKISINGHKVGTARLHQNLGYMIGLYRTSAGDGEDDHPPWFGCSLLPNEPNLSKEGDEQIVERNYGMQAEKCVADVVGTWIWGLSMMRPRQDDRCLDLSTGDGTQAELLPLFM